MTDVERGDILTAVITDPNVDKDRDPITEIDGVTTFVRFDDGYEPEFGETVKIKIADLGDSHMVAVARDK